MTVIFETNNFSVETPNKKPHIDRQDGGHIVILPKVRVEDRTKLAPALAKEMMKLSMVTGEAMMKVMNEHGVDLGRINYQENGTGVFLIHGDHISMSTFTDELNRQRSKSMEMLPISLT